MKAQKRALDIQPVIDELRSTGVTSLNALAKALTERHIPTARGASRWSPSQVDRVLSRRAG
jgi:hypothetical protein